MKFQVIRDENHILNWINCFLMSDKDEVYNISQDMGTRQEIVARTKKLVYQAYIEKNILALESLHLILQMIYEIDFSSVKMEYLNCERKPILTDIASILEVGMLSHESSKISDQELTDYPSSGEEFVRWFKKKIISHNAAIHDFYERFLPDEANVEAIRYFLAQETSLDPRFDDILALMQLGTSGQEKMEIASNYWDEMGNGNPNMVHTKLFSQALDCLTIDQDYINRSLTLDAKISGNLSACLALNRRHYYKAVGYFGVTEFLAPRRFKSLVKAWGRLGLPKEGIKYHELHVKIDAVHGNAWLRNVIKPLVDSNPRIGKEIIEGAIIRLNSSNSYLDKVLADCQEIDASNHIEEFNHAS